MAQVKIQELHDFVHLHKAFNWELEWTEWEGGVAPSLVRVRAGVARLGKRRANAERERGHA